MTKDQIRSPELWQSKRAAWYAVSELGSTGGTWSVYWYQVILGVKFLRGTDLFIWQNI